MLKRPVLGKIMTTPYRVSSDEDLLPNWMQDTVHFSVGPDKEGNPTYVTGLGMPLESLTGYFSSAGWGAGMMKIMGSLNPLIKAPIEGLSGKSFFFGQSWQDYTRPYSSMLANEHIRDNVLVPSGLLNRSVSKSGKVYYSMSANFRQLIASTPISSLWASFDKLFDERIGWGERIIQNLSGLKLSSIGPRQREQAIEQALEKAFNRAKSGTLFGAGGAIGQFKQYYLADQTQKERYQGLFNVQKWLKEKKKERKQKGQ
jgi:hypothetical protein